MHDLDDGQLLRLYVTTRSEPAFTELVGRYVAVVHCSALRQVRDPATAADVTQAVFITLAQKAATLSANILLVNWLLTVTRCAASNARRGEARRIRHEQEAAAMNHYTTAPPESTPEVSALLSHLDDALAGLSTTDRAAVVLRYFQQKPVKDVSVALRMSEDATKKRLTRALERLRKIFTRQGLTLSVAALTTFLATQPLMAAPPASLSTAAIASTALAAAQGTLATCTALTLSQGVLHMMTVLKIKLAAMVTAASLLLAATGVIVHQALAQAPATAPAASKTLIATLPSGAKIEIVALTYEVSTGTGARNTWWAPDGTPLPDFPHVAGAVTLVGDPSLAVAYRIVGPEADPFCANTLRVATATGETLTPMLLGLNGGPEPAPQLFVVDLHVGSSTRTAGLRFDLSTGTWQSRATAPNFHSSVSDMHQGKDLVSLTVHEVAGQVQVRCTDTLIRDAARLWVTAEGSNSANVVPGTDNPFRQTMVDIPLNTRIKSIEFQTRPYDEFAEFTNLALEPNQKAALQIRTGKITGIVAAEAAPKVGEFYVMGQVPRPGVYSLTARKVTLKQALAAGGADPAKVAALPATLVRRLEGDREVRIPLDLAALFAGSEADRYLQANDLLQVGPTPVATAPATSPAAMIRQRFVPNETDAANAFWGRLQPVEKVKGAAMAYAWATIGGAFPVEDQDGKELFRVTLVDGEDGRLILEVPSGKNTKHVELARDKAVPVEVAGVKYELQYPSAWVSPTDKPTTNKAMLMVVRLP